MEARTLFLPPKSSAANCHRHRVGQSHREHGVAVRCLQCAKAGDSAATAVQNIDAMDDMHLG